jgi:hypothetical protein
MPEYRPLTDEEADKIIALLREEVERPDGVEAAGVRINGELFEFGERPVCVNTFHAAWEREGRFGRWLMDRQDRQVWRVAFYLLHPSGWGMWVSEWRDRAFHRLTGRDWD